MVGTHCRLQHSFYKNKIKHKTDLAVNDLLQRHGCRQNLDHNIESILISTTFLVVNICTLDQCPLCYSTGNRGFRKQRKTDNVDICHALMFGE